MPVIVDSTPCHLWSDTLHARALARQARNEWDRGTYVRWTIITAWLTLEMSCENALGINGLGYAFRPCLDRALAAKGLPSLDWGQGIWQRVERFHQLRIDYVHRSLAAERLFPKVDEADLAVVTAREAIVAICGLSGAAVPNWVEFDEDRGWHEAPGTSVFLTVVAAGVDESDPDVVSVGFLADGQLRVTNIFPPGTDPTPRMAEIASSVGIPVTAIVAYRGQLKMLEWPMRMRGGPARVADSGAAAKGTSNVQKHSL
jgi:hypothetical protein